MAAAAVLYLLRLLLALVPRPVLARLDGWARAKANRRAERRRRLLVLQRSRGS